MKASENKSVVYEFGKFVLDPNEKTLFSDGRRLHLPAKEFATLLLLVENNGRALSKDEMMDAVWQGSFVEEGNLTKQISRLRKIFNTNDGEFIETIPKHGYRFSADDLRVTRPALAEPIVIEKRTVGRLTVAYRDDADDVSQPVRAIAGAHRPWPRIARWGLFTALALLLGLAGALAFLREPEVSNSIASPAAIRSIAVLPFRPIGTGAEDEYLGLGMADALITKLSNLREMNVRPTSSVRKYGGQGHDPVTAGRELGVEAVVEGSVQKVGEQVRVTVQLVSVRDGAPLWGQTFDERFTNIFKVQDQISEQVARSMIPSLSNAEREMLAERYTENSEAYGLYLKGRYFWNKRTVDGLKKGIGYFEAAVEKDPQFALAYVGLADSYSLLSDYGSLPPQQIYPLAKQAVMRAVELDDRLAEAHAALGLIKTTYDWEWTGAEVEYRRAIELNPNYETAHQWYAEYLSAMGRHDEAITEIRRAKEINPFSMIINAIEVSVLCVAREYDQGIAQGQKALEMDPHFAEVYGYLERCYDQKGMYRDAIAAHQMHRKLAGHDGKEPAASREAAAATSARVYWQKRLELEMEESKGGQGSEFELAEIYAQLGEKDQALAWLEKAYEKRSVMMMYLKVLPNLDPLRSDTRYEDLVRRVGLPQ